MNNVYAIRRVDAISLRQLATQAHPHNRTHQARWIKAIRFLRGRSEGSIWLADSKVQRVSQ